MNCTQCNAPLAENARFCPKCGAHAAMLGQDQQRNEDGDTTVRVYPPAKTHPSNPLSTQETSAPTADQDIVEPEKTQPVQRKHIPHPELVERDEHLPDIQHENMSLLQHPAPLLYYKLNTTTKGSQMLPAVINSAASNTAEPRRRRGRGGCILGCLTTLIVLLIVLGAGWVFALRPYIHTIAQSELDTAMNSAVNQMPIELVQLLPSGSSLTIPVNENAIHNVIALNIAPSNPFQKPDPKITKQEVRLNFQLYGYPNAISMVPALDSQGHLVANHVNTEGLFALVMSPEEMKMILDKHFLDAQRKLGKTIKKVQLNDTHLDITIG